MEYKTFSKRFQIHILSYLKKLQSNTHTKLGEWTDSIYLEISGRIRIVVRTNWSEIILIDWTNKNVWFPISYLDGVNGSFIFFILTCPEKKHWAIKRNLLLLHSIFFISTDCRCAINPIKFHYETYIGEVRQKQT